MKKRGFGILVFSVLVGMLVGGVLGEVIAFVCPAGVVKDFFLKSISPGFGPGTLNLIVFTLTLGISIKVNIVSLLGIAASVYYFRWY